jgi:cytochrome c peroxidase
VVYQKRLDWANPLITNTYQQNERPLFNEHPIELGVKNNEAKILLRFKGDTLYRSLFKAAYPNDSGITIIHIRNAISIFVNSLVSFQSPYDKYAAGDTVQLSDAAKNGLKLFFSHKLNCASCHTPPLFSVNDIRNNLPADSIYLNIGLYNYTNVNKDPGLFLFTKKKNDLGKFKVPSLRNIAITSPYMHDGSLPSLDRVIDNYSRGGQIIDLGNEKSDGRLSPNKDRRITGFPITAKEKTDLIEFLYSLTDSTILLNPAFANPHKY